jgi:hypothetical protein
MTRTQTVDSKLEPVRITHWLLAGGVVGPLLFIMVFLIEGATRPGYSVWRNYVSDFELSNQGWRQIANFLVCGSLCIGLAVGLRRIWRTGRVSVWGPLLIGLFGLGLVAAGVFVTDPGRGYPPGAPLKGDPQTWHGYAHGINGLVLFNIVLPAACFVLARRFAVEPRDRGWATYSRITGALILVISVLSTVMAPIAENGAFSAPNGLIQRAQIILGWTWVALTALRLLRQEREQVAGKGLHEHLAMPQQATPISAS